MIHMFISENTGSARVRALACVALFSFGLAAVTTPAAAATLIASNSTWRVTPTNPGTGWESDLGFDDSGWQPATELYDVGDYYPEYADAYGIWTSGGQYSTVETEMWARYVFNLASVPLSALLVNGFDDDGDLYINGVKVVDDHNGVANNSFADITNYLVSGDNLIAFMVTDNYPVWGYEHSAWVHVEAVPLPAALPLFALGIGGLIAFGRRGKSLVKR